MKHRYEISYDVRVIERDIRGGTITKKDYEEHLNKLADISEKGCPLVIDEETNQSSEITNSESGENR
ncbi:MAG: hypothetical protein XU11_C0035G0022 [Candidatus Dadabacteria bacterium CSP1-2]|jgi:hypothetical protein|nr:MAG: hypothetical protein XU11_C0035G0022 [Candidatus Dadabacteria bacterium CSP1-2]MBF8301769.1 hypothetical protein [Candidatus Dadabacteria bacterium]